MVSVASLLNPVLEEPRPLLSPASSTRVTPEPCSFSSPPPSKKQKMAKDAAIFSRGKIHGQIRFPPWEKYDSQTLNELHKFSIYPLGRIADYRRHIPYNSDKKGFLEKTGRGAFEVFQYTFRLPGEDRQYTVMWDYNIGLVRITPFFKCCQYAKTVPAKMLNSNPGLRDICHSITGGALAAQGYWMPFEASRAVAATFCYNIRYALVPVFGASFASMCIKPGAEGFGHMIIASEIVARCSQEAKHYKELPSGQDFQASRSSTPSTPEPQPPIANSLWSKQMKSKFQQKKSDTPHSSDAEGSEHYLPSPRSTVGWNRTNISKPWPGTLKLPRFQNESSESLNDRGRFVPPNSPSSSSSSGNISPKTTTTPKKGGTRVKDEARKNNSRADSPESQSSYHIRYPSPITSTKETRAAYVLMQLHLANTTLKDTVHENTLKKLKRRASG